ncbi:hypothetical protein OAO82_01550 [bacterium]|nr:hypothetical protein [Planktomarina temperata]MDC0587567.1 hypothetical protein [bacterium]
MIKFLKRTFYVILGLIALGGAWLYVYLNSDQFAKDIAYLECTMHELGTGSLTEKQGKQFANSRRPKIVGRLRDDWIQDKVLLNWVADRGTSEDGMEPTHKLNVSTNTYSGYSYSDKIKRTFDRDTLLYTYEMQDTSYGQVEYWLTRKCVKVPKNIFEKLRKKSAEATKAKQKI